MSEHNELRPELDDRAISDWNIAFLIFGGDSSSDLHGIAEYAHIFASMPADTNPLFSMTEEDTMLTMRIKNATQRQAVLIGYVNTLNAFEIAGKSLVIKAARIASFLSIKASIQDGSDMALTDISLEAIDLERLVSSFKDFE